MSLLKIITHTAVLLFGFAVAIGATAEAAPLASDRDMVSGVSVTEADCRAQTGRLWVRAENRGFCVRFWLSTVGGNKDEALVAFHGDIGGRIDGKLQLVEQARPISDESLKKYADNGSRLYRGPYFWIARPGAFRSSGDHVKDRRTLLELRIAMAALDALKQQYGFKRFHLVGQSGGGHTVAGLVQLRSDIGCAVIASGPISLRSMQRDIGHPIAGKNRFYDPINHVNTMRQRPGLHLFVVSDRNDKVVSYRSQLEFVERAKAHNLPITHVTATAADKTSHDLFSYGHRLAVDCANETRDQVLANQAVVNKSSDQVPIPIHSQPSPLITNPSPQPIASINETSKKAFTYAQPAPSPVDRANTGPGPRADRLAVQIQAGVEAGPRQAGSAQRVVLYDEDPADPKGKQYVGSVLWRLEPIKASGNQKADVAVRAEIEIPDRKFKMTMSFRRNNDPSLPASHTAELSFIPPPDSSGGSVSKLPGILMKSNGQARGTPLAGLTVKVTDGFFLVGLSNVDADRTRNLQLMKEPWFEVPLVYTNQRRAIIVIEKGAPGEGAFNDALAAWAEEYLTASIDARTTVQSFERTSASDAKTSVQTYYHLTPDCNQDGAITVRVLKQPSQGTLEIVHDRGFTNYAADNIRAKCNAQEVELTRVWYKSNADFKGRDQAQLEAFFTSGTSIKTTLQITVK
jgi:hypothetical protein